MTYELQLGWRYIRSGRASKKNAFISFISWFSMIGIALGVAALVIILSVMNGFQKEVRDKMLSVISHIEITEAYANQGFDAPNILNKVKQNKAVIGAAPFVASAGLAAWGEIIKGVMIRGIDPKLESQVTDLTHPKNQKAINQLGQTPFGVVLGKDLALSLGVYPGNMVTLMLPSGDFTPAGMMPRFKQVTVVGLFESGHYEYDSTLVFMHLNDATKLLRLTGPSGIRIKLKDANQAQQVGLQLTQSLNQDSVYVQDWTQQNKTWFSAVQIEKRMMFVILTLIVAVAAFNLISMLVMTVTDKRSDIAILRTLGASPQSILLIFMFYGATIGFIGTLIGLSLGLLVAFNIDVIIPALEYVFGFQFLPKDIYLISQMPSDPQFTDIAPVVVISLLLSFLATLYPSINASYVKPAEALRYE